MIKNPTKLFIYTVFLAVVSHAGINPSRISSLITAERPAGSTISVAFGKVDADSLDYSFSPDLALNPASVTKLATAAAALTTFGTTFTCSTRVFIEGIWKSDSSLVLGKVYIVGSGDPTFTAERLWLFCRQLRLRGIKTIVGDVVFDDRFFDGTICGPGFGEDQSSRAYEAPIGSLSSSFNTLSVVVRPSIAPGARLIAELFPPVPGVIIVNRGTTTSSSSTTPLSILSGSGALSDTLIIDGTMALKDSPRFIFRRASAPTRNFMATFKAFCAENAITISGGLRSGTIPDSIAAKKPFYIFESEPITTTISAMFKYSSNFAAEMLFKQLGHAATGVGSFESGAVALSRFWKSAHLPGMPRLTNGSGMGDANRISTNQVVSLLRYAYAQQAWFPEYQSALSNAGIDGTVKSRFKNSPLFGNLRAKTGTLNFYGISTLAGYFHVGRSVYAFAIFVNGSKAIYTKSWTLQERILEAFSNEVQLVPKAPEASQSNR